MELFRLLGKIVINNSEANEQLKDTSEEGAKTHSKLSGAFEKIGGAAVKMGKVVAAGVAAGGAAIVKIAKDAVSSYADYEQLVGGVETLFKDSASTVQEYAQNAYKTAGLSANEYMETVTSFSAALLQSLDNDTAAAAKTADLAITDMSDNANKMGSSMESIQTAYQGFAKQNYTMLDNLKLGYGGTKEEMQRLLNDAEKLSGQKFDLSSYADIVEAIHVVQTEMGITGTTAKEASTTIQGSVASMKSAWQNLLTAMADENQNLDAQFGQFVDSVVTVGDNLIPRIQVMLPRIVDGISQLASRLAVNIPPIVQSLLPSLLTGAINIVAALVQNIPSLVNSIITALISTLQSYFSTIQENGAEMLEKITKGIEENLPKIAEKAVEIIAKLAEWLSKNLPTIISVAGEIIKALTKGIVKSLPSLLKKAPEIIGSFAKAIINAVGLGKIAAAGKSIMSGLWSGMKSVWSSVSTWISSKLSWITDKFNAVKNFVTGIKDAVTGAVSTKTKTSNYTNVKAHAAGGILTKPTIFGYTPSTGTYHLGGEAGDEAIAPIDVLKSYVREAVAEANQNTDNDKIYNVLVKILYMLQNGKIIAVMDSEKMGEFVIQTVEREVYA